MNIDIENSVYKNDNQKTSKQTSQAHPLARFLLAVFEFQIALKMYHFQTVKYSAHKSVGKYSDKLEKKMDKFFEIGQGIFGKIYINEHENKVIRANNVFDRNFEDYIKKFNYEIDNVEKIIARHSDLCNIKDEIRGDLSQLIYLLTFQ